VVWQYPNNTLVTFSQFNATGAGYAPRPGEVEFRGTKGTLYLQWNGYEMVPEIITPNEFPARTPLDRAESKAYRKGAKAEIEAKKGTGGDSTALHARNFLDCVKEREKCNCDIETAHRDTSAALIGNIAFKTKSLLEWDGKAEKFTNHPAANSISAMSIARGTS